VQEILTVIESSVRAHAQNEINYFPIYLDYQRAEDKSYCESLAETLRREYETIKPDIVITNGATELRFATQYRNKIFPGVPIVFSMVSTSELENLKMPPGMTGVTLPLGIGGAIDLALQLQPDTNTVAVIQDTAGSTERHWLAVTRSELLRYQSKVKEIDIIGRPSRQMLGKIAALPAHTVVLFQLAPRISADSSVGVFDILAAAARRLPTYSAWDSLCLNYGCIGGAYHDWRKAFRSTGELAARVLNGERPEDIPVVQVAGLQVVVDWRQLRRWHIPESALPPGSVVLYREPSLWERGRKYFLLGIALIVAQALLILALLWQRARKRKAESILRESEKRFRVMADSMGRIYGFR
jgi:ABC-type uncharacterized transport system substrate-binding protein